jgi:hypothetical protein
MPELTNNNVLETERFITNTEGARRNQEDEELLQETAEFIMLTAEKARNPNLSAKLRDLSNMIVINKSTLAKTPGQAGEEVPMTPEEQIAQQGMAGGMPAGMPPGIPGGMPQGMPPPGGMY